MAFFDNKHWVLQRINGAFSRLDDAGLCDLVMSGENYPKQLSKTLICYPKLSTESLNTFSTNNDINDFETYSDDSGDIQLKRKYLKSRMRSNTSQWLEMMEQSENRIAKTRNITWTANDITDEVIKEYFPAKVPVNEYKSCNLSLLTQVISAPVELGVTPFLKYAIFDGKAKDRALTKAFRLFASVLPEESRNYPLYISVVGNAKVFQVIGFICLKLSMLHSDLRLKSVDQYSLYIEDKFGCVDKDFPCLGRKEPIRKFQFEGLVLGDRIDSVYSSDSDTDPDEIKLKVFDNDFSDNNDNDDDDYYQKRKGSNDVPSVIKKELEAMSAHLQKSFSLYLINGFKSRTEVILDINCDTLDIQIVNFPKVMLFSNRKFQKLRSYCIDNIAWVKILSCGTNKASFRIYYTSPEEKLVWGQHTIDDNFVNSFWNLPPVKFKHYDFETDTKTAQEIVNKIHAILDLKSSLSRKFYLSLRDRKQNHILNRRSSFRKSFTSCYTSL